MTVTTIDTKAEGQAEDWTKAWAKAAKTGTGMDALLGGAVVLFGSPKDVTDAVVKGEALISEGRALLSDNEAKARKWLGIATKADEANMSARAFAKATGTNPNTLGRLVRAQQVLTAAKGNGVAMTLGQAITYGNQHTAAEVVAVVAAFDEAEEGVNPLDGTTSVKAEPKAATVESYVKAFDALADRLSALISGDYATPKADTLDALQRQAESFDRLAKQHAALVQQVRKAGRTPSKADRVSKVA